MEDAAGLRARMVERQLRPRGIDDPRVLAVMGEVPRHRFVPDLPLESAYADSPQPIDAGQTISQPYVVAWTAQLLELGPDDRVLEVGTGCGYAAAVLAGLAGHVTSVERHGALAVAARSVLVDLGVDDVEVVHGDGTRGHPVGAPYDAVAVAAAAPQVPGPLLDQLAPGGRLVMPVGDRWRQQMVRVRSTADGPVREDHGGVRFVPLVADG